MPGSSDDDSTDLDKDSSKDVSKKNPQKLLRLPRLACPRSPNVSAVWNPDIRASVREDIIGNTIAAFVQKLHSRETLHLTKIYDLQARPVDTDVRTYQAKIRSCEEEIESLKAQLKLANSDLSAINKELSVTAKSLMESSKEVKSFIHKSQPTFSDVLQSRPSTTARQPFTNQRSEHVVLLRPKGKGTTSDDNRQIVENALVCRNSAARVNRISKVSNGGLIIEAPTSADLEALKAEIECIPTLENQFEVSRPKRRRPQVIILGIENEIDKDRLLQGLTAKNHILCDRKNKPLIEINFPIKARRNTKRVISVDPSIYKRLFDEQGLNFEFSRFRFDNIFSVKCCVVPQHLN
ncbi:hypothetical protein AVEN_139719-1 [Araneus ventricosus]|uniref:Uncharacterized protein n=1 Tax=Araneus ventricosus TaxID=182803 RepID=A0A4Y2IL24_ARAVE|nr:hypothetical protein AVEN_139719-1 [Araneus ventricosus]